MTIKEQSAQLGIKPASLQARLKRMGYRLGVNDEIPAAAMSVPKKKTVIETPMPDPPPAIRRWTPPPKREKISFDRVLDALPVIMFGLAASYGVFHYAIHFMPRFFAYVLAGAFEATYIRLGTTRNLGEQSRKKAVKVSIGAVVISIIYNTISARINLDPDWVSKVSGFAVWILCVLQGAPMALLGYYIVDLLFHKK